MPGLLSTIEQPPAGQPDRPIRVVTSMMEGLLADASRQPLDARRLTAPAETGLRLLSLATVVLAATLVALRI
jgi:hypothetical protein